MQQIRGLHVLLNLSQLLLLGLEGTLHGRQRAGLLLDLLAKGLKPALKFLILLAKFLESDFQFLEPGFLCQLLLHHGLHLLLQARLGDRRQPGHFAGTACHRPRVLCLRPSTSIAVSPACKRHGWGGRIRLSTHQPGGP